MKLWHQDLIIFLPDKQLLGQHRELCALRGKGWGKKHFVVDYIFKYYPSYLVMFHEKVMREMFNRNFKVDMMWCDKTYRGSKTEPFTKEELRDDVIFNYQDIFSEHDYKYLLENLLNLKRKGIEMPQTLWDRCKLEIGFSDYEKLIGLYDNAIKAGDTTNIQKIFYSWIKQ